MNGQMSIQVQSQTNVEVQRLVRCQIHVKNAVKFQARWCAKLEGVKHHIGVNAAPTT